MAMVRGEWAVVQGQPQPQPQPQPQGPGRNKCGGGCSCSYKKTTLIVGFINIVVALLFLRSLYSSLYIYSGNVSRNFALYSHDQILQMEESVQSRKASEPMELVKVVKELERELSNDDVVGKLPQHLKQVMTAEILEILNKVNASGNTTIQHEAVDNWRMEKLEEAKLAFNEGSLNSSLQKDEAGMLLRALDSNWLELSEKLGLWLPVEVRNEEHDDKPEGAEQMEEEILPGRPLPPECRAELHTDYDGVAVRWGLNHHKESAADCCQACLDQAKHAKPNEKKCNIWVYCPSEFGCHSPDIYEHKHQECWLKYAENPKLNFKDKYPESYRNSHPSAPLIVPWASGVIAA